MTFRSALQKLLKQHRPALEQQAQRLCKGSPGEAEDLIQDVCLYAMDRGAQILEHPNPRAWLLTVLKHRFIDYCRSGKRRPVHDGELSTQMAEDDMRLTHFVDRDWINKCTQKLPLHLAAVIRLRLQDMEIRLIGERLGISTSEAGKRLQESLTLLRQVHEEERKW